MGRLGGLEQLPAQEWLPPGPEEQVMILHKLQNGEWRILLGRDFVTTILERLVADSLTFSSDLAKDD